MAATPGTKRVLIADPSDKSRQALATYLREKGLEVIEAADGSKALAETLLRKPDILLLDLSVPILAPERLVQILRSNPNTRSMPVFFLSDREQCVSGFRQGVDEFIRKPFHEEEILLRIQRALYQDPLSEALTGDSEISGNLSQIFLPDLWQMLAMNRKNGILQVEAEHISGSVYIERGEIISAVTRNICRGKGPVPPHPPQGGEVPLPPGEGRRPADHLHAEPAGDPRGDAARRRAPEARGHPSAPGPTPSPSTPRRARSPPPAA